MGVIKPVQKLHPDTREVLETLPSVKAASSASSVSKDCIYQAIQKDSVSGSFRWRYVDSASRSDDQLEHADAHVAEQTLQEIPTSKSSEGKAEEPVKRRRTSQGPLQGQRPTSDTSCAARADAPALPSHGPIQFELATAGRKGTSKYRGIVANKGKWQASYNSKYLGLFSTEEEAAEARWKYMQSIGAEQHPTTTRAAPSVQSPARDQAAPLMQQECALGFLDSFVLGAAPPASSASPALAAVVLDDVPSPSCTAMRSPPPRSAEEAKHASSPPKPKLKQQRLSSPSATADPQFEATLKASPHPREPAQAPSRETDGCSFLHALERLNDLGFQGRRRTVGFSPFSPY
mmetsp:Transcript_79649/g.234279  ORF Transcript_79649/g.234279 Transcript_79649/m.234279 type:complete len:347 (+) Transcript_79649:152-1192(+)